MQDLRKESRTKEGETNENYSQANISRLLSSKIPRGGGTRFERPKI